jgi:hypothetical protein
MTLIFLNRKVLASTYQTWHICLCSFEALQSAFCWGDTILWEAMWSAAIKLRAWAECAISLDPRVKYVLYSMVVPCLGHLLLSTSKRILLRRIFACAFLANRWGQKWTCFPCYSYLFRISQARDYLKKKVLTLVCFKWFLLLDVL